MLVLDTDHLTALQRGGPQGQQLEARLLTATDKELFTTIISVEEQLRGWLAVVHNATNPLKLIAAYDSLGKLIRFFNAWDVLPFDQAAAAELERLRGLRLPHIGPKDLRIAAIVLSRHGTLLTANLTHFELVPDLVVENWITD